MDLVWHDNHKQEQELIPCSPVLSAVRILESVDSSNTYVAQAIPSSPCADARERVAHFAQELGWHSCETGSESTILPAQPTMALVLADSQTRGRGRLDRKWYDHKGQSFLATWALAVPTDLLVGSQSGWLPMAVGIAAVDGLVQTLQECHAHPTVAENLAAPLALKWPNDIFCSGRKLAGVLCEAVTVDQEWSVLVAGLGINLFVPAEELPTSESTSLQLSYEGLPPFAVLRKQLAISISEHLSKEFGVLLQDVHRATDDLRERVCRRSWTLGKQVTVKPVGGKPIVGKALSIGPDAAVQVATDDGRMLWVSTGDVGVLPTVGPR